MCDKGAEFPVPRVLPVALRAPSTTLGKASAAFDLFGMFNPVINSAPRSRSIAVDWYASQKSIRYLGLPMMFQQGPRETVTRIRHKHSVPTPNLACYSASRESYVQRLRAASMPATTTEAGLVFNGAYT